MKYLVRLNPKALNPLTKKVEPSRVWEIEQCADKDSEKYIWHCGAVTINAQPIHRYITALCEAKGPDFILPKEFEFHGIATRGQDNSIVIHEGRRHDVN